MGNQLFQHIFAVGMARKLRAELVTDVSSFDGDPYGRQAFSWYMRPGSPLGTLSQYIGDGCYLLKEGQIQSITDIIQLPKDITTLVLSGYWQKENLLDPAVVQETYARLTDEALKIVPSSLINHVRQSANSVAVHIRRRDYGHQGLCKESYYYAAIEYLQLDYPAAEFFVFTDEPNYALHLMQSRELKFTLVSSGSDIGDLYLMSLCKHFVIANSSYSWWGAFFGESKGGLVFCPKEWVTIGQLPSPCPQRWVSIENAVTPFQINTLEISKHVELIRAHHQENCQLWHETVKVDGNAQSYSNLIDLAIFFKDMTDYVVIKLPDHFPNYYDYQDIDIVCGDIDATYAHISRVAKEYLGQGYRVEEERSGQHFHVDVYAPGSARLNFRFDLIASLDIFKNFLVSPVFHKIVLSTKQRIVKNNVAVFVPAEEYELAIRCMEYLEWKELIPSKKKHLDYIMAKNNNKFLPIITQYTNLVLPSDTSPIVDEDVEPKIQKEPDFRYDYFLIWGHGLQYASKIIEVIRNNQGLKIVSIAKREIGNVPSFVQDVYSCDTVPFHHLIEKTRYLLETPSQVIFVLVINYDPQEMYFGDGVFRHIQSKRIKDVKEEVRNRFNPRNEDGQRTEHHVIHASDYPSQVEHVLSVLKLPPLRHYQLDPHPSIDAPYHLGKIESIRVSSVSMGSLYANILGEGMVAIKDTPHYKYLNGNKGEYINYINKHFGIELTDDHLPESFDQKVRNFSYGVEIKPGKRNLIVAKDLRDGRYQILDGVHRAAILASRDIYNVEIALIE